MSIKKHTLEVTGGICQKVLAELLDAYLEPAFGSLPKKEVDLIVLKALEDLGYLNKEPSLYELVSKLRVTRTKARNLIYDQDLRRLDDISLDIRVKEALKTPLLQKQGDLFVLEIENPLVIDHLRSKLQQLGHASDGSFSPSLVKISIGAVAALIEDYLTKSQRKAIQKSLTKAGVPDSSLQGMIKSTIKAAAKKVAQDSGEALVEKASDYISPVIDGSADQVFKMIGGLFPKKEQSE